MRETALHRASGAARLKDGVIAPKFMKSGSFSWPGGVGAVSIIKFQLCKPEGLRLRSRFGPASSFRRSSTLPRSRPQQREQARRSTRTVPHPLRGRLSGGIKVTGSQKSSRACQRTCQFRQDPHPRIFCGFRTVVKEGMKPRLLQIGAGNGQAANPPAGTLASRTRKYCYHSTECHRRRLCTLFRQPLC